MEFINLLNKTSTLNHSNAKYYKLNDFNNVLTLLGKINVEVGDTILTPFYICDRGILELYDYELNIRQVRRPNADDFILDKTGKQNINEVDPTIEQKLRHCYLETISPDGYLPVNRLKEFVDYVKNSSEIKERIYSALHEFCDDNLYFEIY